MLIGSELDVRNVENFPKYSEFGNFLSFFQAAMGCFKSQISAKISISKKHKHKSPHFPTAYITR